jgi:hypothetical protein
VSCQKPKPLLVWREQDKISRILQRSFAATPRGCRRPEACRSIMCDAQCMLIGDGARARCELGEPHVRLAIVSTANETRAVRAASRRPSHRFPRSLSLRWPARRLCRAYDARLPPAAIRSGCSSTVLTTRTSPHLPRRAPSVLDHVHVFFPELHPRPTQAPAARRACRPERTHRRRHRREHWARV